MYNPSRGGVRGGADQFTWESVKTDKHRENYLGHSLKAPVGRWQKGKDLSWYAKERKDAEGSIRTEKSELAAIKQAEEEAMLIALGHNVVRKETQALTKEEMKEALKRNIGDRDELNIERVDGVGATSRRAAMLTGSSKDSRMKREGVMFEHNKGKDSAVCSSNEISSLSPSNNKRKKSKKSSKKHKKEKKKHSYNSSNSEDDQKHKTKHKKLSKQEDNDYSSKDKDRKKSKSKHKHSSNSNDYESDYRSKSKTHHQRYENRANEDIPPKRHRHDTSESE